MRLFILSLFVALPVLLMSQERPRYCDDIPTDYEAVRSPGGSPAPLPKFATQPVVEYKVQVAILRNTDPSNYPFHDSLVARYRPCEEVWVVESRDSYKSKAEAEALKKQLRALGYGGAYITELIGFSK